MDVLDYLHELALVNRGGAGFLLAYGVTWLVAAAVAWKFGARAGAFGALFQGMVGLPMGLGLTALLARGPRPEEETLNALSFYLSMGQLLVLPLAIILIVKERYSLAVGVLATVLAVHFVPYAWLYQTVTYLVVAVVVAAGAAASLARESEDGAAVAGVCALTGLALLSGGGVALIS